MKNSVNMLLKTSRFWLQEERKKDMHFLDVKKLLFNDFDKTSYVPHQALRNSFHPSLLEEHEAELPLNIHIPMITEFETMENEIKVIQYNANSSIEDKLIISSLKSLDAEIISVFDGHGGDKLSEYCANNLVELIDSFIEKNKNEQIYENNNDKLISEALKWTYNKLDSNFYENIFKEQIALNNKKIKNVGSCGLTVIIYDQKLYVANCGDSEAIVVLRDSDKKVIFKDLNTRLSVNNPLERERLKKEFPHDEDIVVEEQNGSFYVKGRLQPTHALGDYHLKYGHLFKGKGDFHGPYIKSDPEISIFKIEKDFKTVVVASDGVWDFVDKSSIASASLEKNPHEFILEKTLDRIAEIHKRTAEEIRSLPEGKKRDFHDDISVIVVSLGTSSKLAEKRTIE